MKKILMLFSAILLIGMTANLLAQGPIDPPDRGNGCPVFGSYQTYTVYAGVPADIDVNLSGGWNNATITYPAPSNFSGGTTSNGVGGTVAATTYPNINDTFYLAQPYTVGHAKYVNVTVSKTGCATVSKTLTIVVLRQ